MASAEQLNHAKAFLAKAEEYLASAGDNLVAERHTAAAGDAIHAGISSKDAIVTALTGATRKVKDHAAAAQELKTALGTRADAPAAEKALRELISAKGDVEYGTAQFAASKAEPLIRRAQFLVELAVRIVRLGG
jgi:predicted lipid-binding transport protein (Tim44 family)